MSTERSEVRPLSKRSRIALLSNEACDRSARPETVPNETQKAISSDSRGTKEATSTQRRFGHSS